MLNKSAINCDGSLLDDWPSYFSLVKKIACSLKSKLPQTVRLEDLVQAGMVGLLESMKSFNIEKGASFSTYAGIRIKGAMIDELRKGDWAPRSTHRNARQVYKVIELLENEMGKKPKDIEVCQCLGVSLEEYHHIIQDIDATKMAEMDNVSLHLYDVDAGYDLNSKLQTPFESVQQMDCRQKLEKYVQQLTKKERLVIALYYQEDKNLREIADIIGVTESRISQIHSQAVYQLKNSMLDGNAYLN